MMKIFPGESLHEFETAWELEWLETNGLGGYASSTVSGANTRRYHGILVAATNPPLGRQVVLSKLEETIELHSVRVELSANQYPGAVHPVGFQWLELFQRNLFPEFIFNVNGIRIRKTIAAVQGQNTTLLLYEVLEAPEAFQFELAPLCSARNYHSLTFENEALYRGYLFHDGIFQTKNYPDTPELFISVPGSRFEESMNWYHHFQYEQEKRRGLEFQEDLFNHGKFTVTLKAGQKLGVMVSLDDPSGKNAFRLWDEEKKRRQELVKPFATHKPIQRLALAADQFIVNRGEGLKTILAGYHWFTDWGRDTMISLPGICLCTGRSDDARKIMQSFAENVSEGLVPNRFMDDSGFAEYNTADATLWFFNALYLYYLQTKDIGFIRIHLPVLDDIIQWHERGTKYNIHVDQDGLLYAAEEGVQLTWMDAKIGDWVVTPRRGKPVEINALWYNALAVLSYFHHELGNPQEALRYHMQSEAVKEQFIKIFWNEKYGYLFDYVDGDYKNDDIRPNQIYALSLPFPVLSGSMAHQMLNVVESHLLTPRGLRSLSWNNAQYHPYYNGDVWQRDSAYHQGTVWSYLLGPFIDALIYLRGDNGRTEAKAILHQFFHHLDEAGVGTISEIFDGESPHRPCGCIAQAWSVGEILRVSMAHRLYPE